MSWKKVQEFLKSKEAKKIAVLLVGVAAEVIIIIVNSSGKNPPQIR